MAQTLEAIVVMLAAFVPVDSPRTLPVGVHLVATGGDALVLSRLVDPLGSTN